MRFPQEEGAHRQRRERVGRVTRVSFPLPFPNLKPTHKRKQKKMHWSQSPRVLEIRLLRIAPVDSCIYWPLRENLGARCPSPGPGFFPRPSVGLHPRGGRGSPICLWRQTPELHETPREVPLKFINGPDSIATTCGRNQLIPHYHAHPQIFRLENDNHRYHALLNVTKCRAWLQAFYVQQHAWPSPPPPKCFLPLLSPLCRCGK